MSDKPFDPRLFASQPQIQFRLPAMEDCEVAEDKNGVVHVRTKSGRPVMMMDRATWDKMKAHATVVPTPPVSGTSVIDAKYEPVVDDDEDDDIA